MTLTQSIILTAFAFFAGCVVTYIIKKANEYQRPMLPKREREFEEPRCPECLSRFCNRAYDRMAICEHPISKNL